MPPVSPSCSAASKWILQPRHLQVLPGPSDGIPCASSSSWRTDNLVPAFVSLSDGQTGDYRAKPPFSTILQDISLIKYINTTSLRVSIISKPNMVAFSSSCSLGKECYTYSPLVLQAHHHVRGSTNETWNLLHLFIYSGRKLALENLCCNYKMTAQHPQPLGATRGMSNSKSAIIHVLFPPPPPQMCTCYQIIKTAKKRFSTGPHTHLKTHYDLSFFLLFWWSSKHMALLIRPNINY